jgi:hypothetical protein
MSRAAASGEVGLLAEEAAQRLLSVFSDAGFACLRQIHGLCATHPENKRAGLLQVGLDLVLKWDVEVVHEETVRLETSYPEVPTLHSYTYLWLLDRLCSDRDLASLSVPPVAEAYAGFMKRLVAHRDVRAGRSFAEGPELFRRTVYVDCFRGAYHDLLQRRGLWSTRTASVPAKLACPAPCAELTVGPEEAASQVGAALATSRRVVVPRYDAEEDDAAATSQVSSRSGSALKSAMLSANNGPAIGEAKRPQPKATPPTVFALPGDGVADARSARLSEVAPPSESKSLETKAITVTGPCFFGNEAQQE